MLHIFVHVNSRAQSYAAFGKIVRNDRVDNYEEDQMILSFVESIVYEESDTNDEEESMGAQR